MFILSERNILRICVLSQCIVYSIHFQNIHTFTFQKYYYIHFYCFFLKLSIAFHVSLNERSKLVGFGNVWIINAKQNKQT